MLNIKIPNICESEQLYIVNVLLYEFLGVNFKTEFYNGRVIEISRSEKYENSSKLTLDISFFIKANKNWLNYKSLPDLPLSSWEPAKDGIEAKLVNSIIPVLYGSSGIVKKNEKHIHLNLDIFGSAFFMLSRYEEAIVKLRDNHGRFPASASVSFKENFLQRPIINEYLEILFFFLKSTWPDLCFKRKKFRKLISCDLDHPFDLAGYSLKRTIMRICGRLIRDKVPQLALYDFLNYLFKKFNSDRFDEYRKNIDWIMKVNNLENNKVTFNFIPIQTDPNKEDNNDVRSKKISTLLKHIIQSGHEIGFHPGYKTYKCIESFEKSADALKDVCINENIDISNLGGRQHYLRFDILQTPILWEKYGYKYDSSLGYADHAGFRCGICYEYSMYDLVNRKKMKIKERPLIVMECSITSKLYEGLGFSNKALERFIYFVNICQKFDGDFTLLWHNSEFCHSKSRHMYKTIISL